MKRVFYVVERDYDPGRGLYAGDKREIMQMMFEALPLGGTKDRWYSLHKVQSSKSKPKRICYEISISMKVKNKLNKSKDL